MARSFFVILNFNCPVPAKVLVGPQRMTKERAFQALFHAVACLQDKSPLFAVKRDRLVPDLSDEKDW
jgi:hypothetical protein